MSLSAAIVAEDVDQAGQPGLLELKKPLYRSSRPKPVPSESRRATTTVSRRVRAGWISALVAALRLPDRERVAAVAAAAQASGAAAALLVGEPLVDPGCPYS